MSVNVAIVFSVVISLICMKVNGDVIVQTKYGKVAGIEVDSIIRNEKYYSFLGVPYAQPPIKELRFKAPLPHPGWDNIFDAKKETPQCSQYYLPNRQIKNYGFYGSEDCLHLSIQTPKLPHHEDLNLPVIVFLYNEQFKVTYNASNDYGADFFMKEKVILVTVNHRIGSLGFLSFEDNLLPGNNGLRDVILALKWIQQNIKNFGGDASRVTLMGSQGGATIVDILLHSSKAKGLFSAAILQSGTSWDPTYFDNKPRKRAIELSEYLEDQALSSSYLLQVLKDVPAIKLTESELYIIHPDESREYQRGTIPFGPIIEHDHPDAVITILPEKDPSNINIPVMIGYNSREGIDMSQRFLQKPNFLTYADRDFLLIFPRRVDFRFRINDHVYYAAIDEIKEFYFEEAYVKISKPGEYITYAGDLLSMYPIDYTVRAYANVSSSAVYYYMFDYSGELNLRKKTILEEAITIEGTWGATYTDELCYLFICKPLKHLYKKFLDEDAEEMTVLDNMIKLWTNFAKTGKPTSPDDKLTWKPATKENKECLVISDQLQMKNNLHADKINFWDKFLAKYGEMAVDGLIKDIKDEL